jgi:hypothetical protein
MAEPFLGDVDEPLVSMTLANGSYAGESPGSERSSANDTAKAHAGPIAVVRERQQSGRLVVMTKRKMQRQAVNVGFESRNVSEAVELLQWVASRSEAGAASDILAANQIVTRESLMSRAEQPFVEEQDHIVYGRVYGLRNERFGVVYDMVPSEPENSIETRGGGPATVLATFWICP